MSIVQGVDLAFFQVMKYTRYSLLRDIIGKGKGKGEILNFSKKAIRSLYLSYLKSYGT